MQQTLKLADQLKNLFMSKNCQMASLREIILNLNDKYRGTFLSQNDLQDMIEELTTIVPRWLEIRKTSRGDFVKIMSKKTQMCEVRDQISKHF
mmetsp:Transcript_20053/g.19032  ORF Transcript_20053/g.19032 Transcript_20053/m.19032 type:complete len:93 (+) Transcript_20053:383-661(+)